MRRQAEGWQDVHLPVPEPEMSPRELTRCYLFWLAVTWQPDMADMHEQAQINMDLALQLRKDKLGGLEF